MRLAVIAVLGVAACSDDPSLRVDVEHPIEVPRTTISVYEPQSFRCEQVELGDVSEAELAAARVAEIEIAGDVVTGSLDDLSRTAPKVIVARGFDVDGTLATAGCAEQGEIEGADRITIVTSRAALASIGPLVVAGNDPFSLTVVLTDTRGVALKGHPVSWRVYGPAGSTAAPSPNVLADDGSGVWRLETPTCANADGVRRIHPVPPSTIGGFAVQIRPSWAIEPPPLVSGFTRIDAGVVATTPAVGIKHPCAIRSYAPPGGGAAVTSIVCVEATSVTDSTLVGREYRVAVVNGQARVSAFGSDFLITEPQIAAVYSVARSDTVRDVYAVSRAGKVIGLLAPSVAAATASGLRPGSIAIDALVLPRCSSLEPRLLIRVEKATERRLVWMPVTGGTDQDWNAVRGPTGDVLSMRTTGCVTELDPRNVVDTRQAVVVDVPARDGTPNRQSTSAYFDCVSPNKEQCFVDLPVPRAGAGFFPGDTPLLVGANLDASGVVVSRWAVLFDSGNYRRVELDRVSAGALPLHIVYGQFDTDGKHDAFWDTLSVDPDESAFQLTYAQLAGTQPLSALSASLPLKVDDVLVGDATNDGKDDIVLLGTSAATGSPIFGLVVLPSQVPAALPPLDGRDTCP